MSIKKYDLMCILPLYGANSHMVAHNMVMSLFSQEIKNYKVKFLIFYDETVPRDGIIEIAQLGFNSRSEHMFYELYYTGEHTSSGYKRNLGLAIARTEADYVWFIDQDDYILGSKVIQSILDTLTNHPEADITKLNFSIPPNIDTINSTLIHNVFTMPWLYVIKTDSLSVEHFDEDREYGSDLEYSIRYLVRNKYLIPSPDKIGSFNLNPNSKKWIVYKVPMYFYNYLNQNSFIGQINRNKEIKGEADKALVELREKYWSENAVQENN